MKKLQRERTLPGGRQADALRLVPVEAASVGRRANEEDEAGLLKLALHPAQPALGRVSDVLVQGDVEALIAKLIGESKHAINVRVGVVGVGDEDASRHGRASKEEIADLCFLVRERQFPICVASRPSGSTLFPDGEAGGTTASPIPARIPRRCTGAGQPSRRCAAIPRSQRLGSCSGAHRAAPETSAHRAFAEAIWTAVDRRRLAGAY